jgi:hypothetical protein
MNHEHEPTSPLDPEERALAQRLARLGPRGEPSPTLDARVLAAAHAAAAPPRAPRARWPLRLGVAASVALALGLAWQLRPLPGADPIGAGPVSAGPVRPMAGVAPASAPEAETSAAASDAIDAHVETVAAPGPAEVRALAPPPAPPAPPPPPASTSVPAPAPAVAQRDVAQPAAARAAKAALPEEPPIVFDAPSPVEARPQAAPSAPAAFKSMESQPAMEADTPAGDVPPATVATPAVRDAWLARIRALIAAGQVDEARMSLHEFKRRYPAYVLPDDLRALAP